eukprot:TRINITY_DN19302_c0_g1_i1.p1 TRINITY_DN19302_c0_g1~~TRINITY_DN19302_c0_g1_i1.p1  ORF type:complete len:435 (+),score=87.10 TRINITY_DN19302_c0_g1_i1:60-1364(+)
MSLPMSAGARRRSRSWCRMRPDVVIVAGLALVQLTAGIVIMTFLRSKRHIPTQPPILDCEVSFRLADDGDVVDAVSVFDHLLSLGCAAWLHEGPTEAHRALLSAAEGIVESISPPQHPWSSPVAVRRVHWTAMSYEEFVEEHAKAGRPVVLEGLADLMRGPDPWTPSWLANVCEGGPRLQPSVREIGEPRSWGGMEQANESLSVREFIAAGLHQTAAADGRLQYIHDWPLIELCPGSLVNFTIPKYFSGDLLQRLPSTGGDLPAYRNSWPSLFMGPKGSRSALHRDSFASHFIMAHFHGRKRWRLFNASQRELLYPTDEGAAFHVDAFADDPGFPLARFATPFETTAGPGDVLFVPSQWLHAVHNLDDIVGASMNYVDGTNLQHSLRVIARTALKYERHRRLLRQFVLAMDRGMADRTHPADLSFVDFKLQSGR